MTVYLLGLDSGLTATKSVLFDETGAVVASSSVGVAQHSPHPHHVERDMAEHWQAAAQTIREVLEQAAAKLGCSVQPAAVSVTGHGDGAYPLDKEGKPLGRAALSLDSRASAILESWLADGTAEKALDLTGQIPFVSSPAPVLAYIKAHEPERYNRIGALLSCKDWLRYCLTGQVATDFTEASVAFTDVRNQVYSDAALSLYGLADLRPALPDVHLPHEEAGRVSQGAARETGLAAGIPVAAGLHDVTACALGCGVHKPGRLALVAGTYSINEMLVDRPRMNPGWNTRNGLLPGQWMLMSVSPASSANLEWFVHHFARDLHGSETVFAQLQHEINEAAGEADDITYLPFLYGSPHGAALAGGFSGLRGWHGRGHMLRAVARGIVFNHCHHVDLLDPDGAVSSASLTGGSSRNPWFCQLFADSLTRDLAVPETQEAGALGAALCAGRAAGLYSDWEDAIAKTRHGDTLYTPANPPESGLLAARRVYQQQVAQARAALEKG